MIAQRAFVGLVIVVAAPAFMLRSTGVMDDSVFWVVAKALDSGKILYRDIFFTQPPLFIFIPQLLWRISTNIFVHRAFLLALWLANGSLFFLALNRVDRHTRLVLTGLFLSSAFMLQAYALHTEIFIVCVFLVAALAIERGWTLSPFILGLSSASALFFKPVGPLVFLPALCCVLLPPCQKSLHRVVSFGLGALVPCAVVFAYLASQGLLSDFWQQAIVDNGNVGISTTSDWFGYLSLAVVPLLLPGFAGLALVDTRWRQLEWWLSVALFVGLLALELVRGARHYGLLNLCLLTWMAVRAQPRLCWQRTSVRAALSGLMALAVVFQSAVLYQILARGSIANELSATHFVQTLPRGSLQVFANDSPRIYMLLNNLPPAYAYLFVYDTNRDLVDWDSYVAMIDDAPPDYIAVNDSFAAIEYGNMKSTTLVDATSVKTWIEHRGYAPIGAGPQLGLTVYQRLSF